MKKKNEDQIAKVVENFKKLSEGKKMYVLGFMQANILNAEEHKQTTA